MRTVTVLRSGLMTTVQDDGRWNHRDIGVARGGAMDRLSHELANQLVGNSCSEATLEMTLTGDQFHFSFDAVIAVTGADLCPVVIASEDQPHPDGMTQANTDVSTRASTQDSKSLPLNRPVAISKGTVLRFQQARRGCRCYLAVAGGFDIPEVLGSRSTLLRAALGGLHGRALKNGDQLAVNDDHANLSANSFLKSLKATLLNGTIGTDGSGFSAPSWFVRPIDLPASDVDSVCVLRAVHGEHLSLADAESVLALTASEFVVSASSDRMGYRLIGHTLQLRSPVELLSEGTVEGTIQLPPDGNPILLMADCAPTGGYPRIAHVITADLPTAAQLRPGQKLRFDFVSLNEAHKIFRSQRAALQRALMLITEAE